MSRSKAGLARRLDALETVVALGAGRLPPDLVEDARGVSARAGSRLRLSGEHTVVALAGATGSGKSSLFNAVAGAQLAAVGARRPTTSSTQAVVLGPDAAAELLDWLAVDRRRHGSGEQLPELSGLVLLDLPDHDSTEVSHRAEVDRLVRLVDAFVWVLDPQKYADAAVHDAYLRPLAAHRDVMVVVLNQADRLADSEVASCVRDLHRLLAEDGLDGVPVLAISALTPTGTAPLHKFLASTVADHRARTARIEGDLAGLAGRLAPLAPPTRSDPALRTESAALRQALGRAAGVPAVMDAVGRAHERRGVAAVGWPPLRWLSKLRPDPLRRLGLGRSSTTAADPVLRRTSMPAGSAVSRAGVDSAVRAIADAAAQGRPDPWSRVLRAAARSRDADIADALDRAVGGAHLGMDRPPRWWRAAAFAQWVLLAVAVAGAVWLGLLAVLGYLQIDLRAPSLGPFAWPTVLLVGGLVGGLLLRVLARPFVAMGARRRRRRAGRELTGRVGEVADNLVLAPLRAELAVYGELASAVRGLQAR